ncbi:MAG: hypothetical protein JO338_10700 [Aquitalea sp.]|nr:hypothetical protein [Aquitalea sp.]
MTGPRGRWRLGLILLLCLLPWLAAWLSYRCWPPQGGQSYGQLLPTRPFAAAARSDWPKGRWVLVGQSRGACDQPCRQRLYTMRQIHLAQGEAASRLQRVWLYQHAAITAPPDTLQLAQLETAPPLRGDGFYLIDPLGNQVLFYPDAARPDKIIKEVLLVLKVNNGLG